MGTRTSFWSEMKFIFRMIPALFLLGCTDAHVPPGETLQPETLPDVGVEETAAEPVIWPALHLAAVGDQDGQGVAMVNGHLLAVGDQIDEVTLVSVQGSQATFSLKGESLVLVTGQRITATQPEVGTQPSAPPAPSQPASSTGLSSLLGNELVTADGGRMPVSGLQGSKIGLYFSAEWCPPCRTFTPKLVQAYSQMRQNGKSFDLVFVSSDRTSDDMIRYMRGYGMTWGGIPHGSPQRDALGQRFGIRGIPALVVIDRNGNVLSSNARGDVERHGAAAFDRW